LRAFEDELGAAGVPLASRSATRVSARSTLTSTCFFNLIQSFGMESSRAPGGLDTRRLAACEQALARPVRGRRVGPSAAGALRPGDASFCAHVFA
jgi:hypothetical protein